MVLVFCYRWSGFVLLILFVIHVFALNDSKYSIAFLCVPPFAHFLYGSQGKSSHLPQWSIPFCSQHTRKSILPQPHQMKLLAPNYTIECFPNTTTKKSRHKCDRPNVTVHPPTKEVSKSTQKKHPILQCIFLSDKQTDLRGVE